MEYNYSHIQIGNDIEALIETTTAKLLPNRAVVFFEEEFKIESAKSAIAEAYISEAQTKYIILASQSFNTISQNSLLKLLEEPPKNIEFIIITTSKASLLPTIRSRLPMVVYKSLDKLKKSEVQLAKNSLSDIFTLLKQSQNIKKVDAKLLLQSIFDTMVQNGVKMSSEQLQNFDLAIRALELNARPQNVIAMVLAGLNNAN